MHRENRYTLECNYIDSNQQLALVCIHIDQWHVSSCIQTDYLLSEEDLCICSRSNNLDTIVVSAIGLKLFVLYAISVSYD